MVVAVDVTNTLSSAGGAATGMNNNFSFTVGAGDNALAFILFFDGDPGAITAAPSWDAQTTTQIGTTQNNGSNIYATAWGLVSPNPGVHSVLAATWTNSVAYEYLFLPVSGADTSSFANAFQNFAVASGNSSSLALTITDASATPSNNLAVVGNEITGGTMSLTSGQTAIGNQIGAANSFNSAYGTSSASQAFTWTGTLSDPWLEIGFTINAPSGGGGGGTDDRAFQSGALAATTLFRERLNGLWEPVREIIKPKRPRLVPGFAI